MLLYYVRHGDPVYRPDSLTPLGKRQAEALGRRLARYGLDEIYTSTSDRAIETAVPVCELLKKEPVRLDFAHESLAWEQMTCVDTDGGRRWVFESNRFRNMAVTPEMRALGDAWYRHPAFAGMPLGEGIARVRREAHAFLKGLGYHYEEELGAYRAVEPNDRRVALFAHQGFGLCFLSAVLDIPYPTVAAQLDMSHSDLTVIEFRVLDGISVPRMLTLSNDAHLYAENLPTRYQNRLDF
ncbi:MAG: histidine phosphatase family protein [Ruminococcaceae bacterium]|nr:histidine phosphatase family protein [Oscillospiraceae bacterium]